MVRRGPNRRRYCARHKMPYITWADAAHTKLARCPECEDEERRADAAAARRAQERETKEGFHE